MQHFCLAASATGTQALLPCQPGKNTCTQRSWVPARIPDAAVCSASLPCGLASVTQALLQSSRLGVDPAACQSHEAIECQQAALLPHCSRASQPHCGCGSETGHCPADQRAGRPERWHVG